MAEQRYDTERMSLSDIMDAIEVSEPVDDSPVTALPCPNNQCTGGRVVSCGFSIMCPACRGNMVVTAKEYGDFQQRLRQNQEELALDLVLVR